MTSADSNTSVLHVITRPVGGSATQVAALDRALRKAGLVSTIVCGLDTHGEGDVLADTEHVSMPSLRRPIRPVRDLQAFRDLSRLIAERRPTVVHTHQAKAGAVARLAASRLGVPVVHTYHGYAIDEIFSPLTARLFLAVERRLGPMSGALIAPSRRLRDDLLARGVASPERWHVIPYGIDRTRWTPLGRDDARRIVGLPPDGTVVGIVGRLAAVKDHHLFIDVAERIATTRPEVVFVVAGDGELRDELERVAKERLGGSVRFLGHVSDLRPVYSSLDVLVSTSRSEGTPVTVLEAGVANVPAVATDVGGVREVVADGATGYVVDRADPALFAARVVSLLDAPATRQAMGRAAADLVVERFDEEALAARTASLYAEVAERGRSGG